MYYVGRNWGAGVAVAIPYLGRVGILKLNTVGLTATQDKLAGTAVLHRPLEPRSVPASDYYVHRSEIGAERWFLVRCVP
jgi:hypothetical protein